MDEIRRTRELGAYAYTLTLTPEDGLNGTLRIEIPGAAEISIRPPEGWLFTATKHESGASTFSFAAPNEPNAQILYFPANGVDHTPHVRVPPLEPQKMVMSLLTDSKASARRTVDCIEAFYDSDHPNSMYGAFLKDCQYMLSHEEYIEVMAILAEADARFTAGILPTQVRWFANRMMDNRTKYPIRNRAELDAALDEYTQYESLLDLSVEDVREVYLEKFTDDENPATQPEDFGFDQATV